MHKSKNLPHDLESGGDLCVRRVQRTDVVLLGIPGGRNLLSETEPLDGGHRPTGERARHLGDGADLAGAVGSSDRFRIS